MPRPIVAKSRRDERSERDERAGPAKRPEQNTRRASSGLGRWWAVALIVAMGAAGCGESSSPDGSEDSGQAELRLEALSTFGDENGRVETDDSFGTLFTWTSAKIVIERIALDLPDDVTCSTLDAELSTGVRCDSPTDGPHGLRIDGPIVVDLITGETTSSFDGVRIPAVEYEDIDVEVNVLDAGDAGDQDERLAERTFLGAADFEYENQKRALHLEMGFKGRAKANEAERMSLGGGETLVLQFDAGRWLDNIPVTECLLTGHLNGQDATVLVDDQVGGECEDAPLQFRQNFEDSLDFAVEFPADTE